MNREINILFLGGAKRLSLAERFIEAGNKLNYKINLYSYELTSEVPIIEIAKIIIGKKWTDERIYSDLEKYIACYNIHIVLPFLDPAISTCIKLKRSLKHVYIPISDEEICLIMFDKVLSNEWLLRNNIPVPEYDGIFPAIAKPRLGSASKGIILIKTKNEMKRFLLRKDKNNFLIQKYLNAQESTVDCFVAKSGTIIGIVPRMRLAVIEGEVNKSITTDDEEILDYSKQILSTGNFRGPITIQFLRSLDNGSLYVMEVNLRFGGGVINSIEAGFDIPLLILKEFLEIPISKYSNWKKNLLMMRVNREVFLCK